MANKAWGLWSWVTTLLAPRVAPPQYSRLIAWLPRGSKSVRLPLRMMGPLKTLALVVTVYGGAAHTVIASELEDCYSSDVARSVAACTRIIENESSPAQERADAFEVRGGRRLISKDYDGALADFDALTQLKPRRSKAYELRGMVRFLKGDAKHALSDLDSAIRLDPHNVSAYRNRGGTYFALRDFRKALADLTTAIRIKPRDAEAWKLRGSFYVSMLQVDRGLADLNQAIRLKPDDADSYNNRGGAYFIKGMPERALADFSEAVRLQPEDLATLTNRGYANFVAGRFAGAAADLARVAAKGDAPFPALWRYLALRKAGQEGDETLQRDTTGVSPDAWPSPIIELYVGHRSPKEVLAAATTPESRCQANFYIGEWQLLHGKPSDGAKSLNRAKRSCSRKVREYIGARAELRRLRMSYHTRQPHLRASAKTRS